MMQIIGTEKSVPPTSYWTQMETASITGRNLPMSALGH
jgi:hypothetical protein